MPAVYITIWLALALFAAGEWGRMRTPDRSGWPWLASTVGLGLAIVHTWLAFGVVHDWSHDVAVRHTAEQTRTVFGMAFGAGVYVNYLFFAVWAADLVNWRLDGSVDQRSRIVSSALRVFYFVIIVNAAVVFAAGWRRTLGLALILILVAIWIRPVPGRAAVT